MHKHIKNCQARNEIFAFKDEALAFTNFLKYCLNENPDQEFSVMVSVESISV